MAKLNKLPNGFEALEPYLEAWVLPNSQARAEKRMTSAYADIKVFYDVMLAHAESALTVLQQCELGALDSAHENLLKLMLALAEIGPAVEWYGESGASHGFDPRRFPLHVQLSDTARQE